MSKSTNDNDGGAQHQQYLFNYHDADIYSSDLAILDSPTAWLNDAVLHFQLTRLEQFHQDYTGGHSENLFLDPYVLHTVKMYYSFAVVSDSSLSLLKLFFGSLSSSSDR